MEELSIRIKIAEREYPMKVKRTEEERMRVAGKLVNEKIKHYREKFGIDDKQDLLAMVAFDCLIEKMADEETKQTIDQTVVEKIQQLNQLVSQVVWFFSNSFSFVDGRLASRVLFNLQTVPLWTP